MQVVKSSKGGTGWKWVLGIIVGLIVCRGVAAIVPGASCADGTSSAAIGRRGACSYHDGVSPGWKFLGIPAGLIAGIGSIAIIEGLTEWGATRRRRAALRREQQMRYAPLPVIATARSRHAREDLDEFLRRAMLARHWVRFQYDDEDGTGQRERTARPRWLQMSEVAGESAFCVIADCGTDGRRLFALSRMQHLHVLELAPGA